MNQQATVQLMPMTAAHVNEVCNVVGQSFTKEPMTEALDLTYEQVRADFAKVVEEIGPKGMSTVAVDTTSGRIVGCCLNKDFTMQPMEDGESHSDTLAVFDLVDELDDTAPELKTLAPGDMFHVYILAVDSDYKKQHIGDLLVQEAEKLAREGNFKQSIAEVTGPVSQHIFIDKCDYQEIGRVNYKEYSFNGDKVFENIDSCEACLLVRKDLA